MLKIRPLFIIW